MGAVIAGRICNDWRAAMSTRSAFCLLGAALFLIGIYWSGRAVAQQNERAPADEIERVAQQDAVEHGEYIVHHLAMCIYCHTPRNEEGEPDTRQLLSGAPMPIASPFPRQTWAFQAPKIAGLPGGWTEDDTVTFLQTGESPTGHQPRPPMPPFRMNEEDARAVAVYLKSL
jgi:mono/diheme cytochrome c family protein